MSGLNKAAQTIWHKRPQFVDWSIVHPSILVTFYLDRLLYYSQHQLWFSCFSKMYFYWIETVNNCVTPLFMLFVIQQSSIFGYSISMIVVQLLVGDNSIIFFHYNYKLLHFLRVFAWFLYHWTLYASFSNKRAFFRCIFSVNISA